MNIVENNNNHGIVVRQEENVDIEEHFVIIHFMNRETLAMDFWGRVEELQKKMGITLREACEKAGLNYGTAINQKSNATLPNLISGALLARQFDTSVEWLLFGNISLPRSQKALWSTFAVVAEKEELYNIVKKLPTLTTRKLQAIDTLLEDDA